MKDLSELKTKILQPTDPGYFVSTGSMGRVRPGKFGRKDVVVKEVHTPTPLARAAFLTEVHISLIAAQHRVGPIIHEWLLCKNHTGIIVMQRLEDPLPMRPGDVRDAVELVIRMGNAGIYHNDAYTRNIMRNGHGKLRFIDFGYSVFFPGAVPISLMYVDLVGLIYGHRYADSLELNAGLAQLSTDYTISSRYVREAAGHACRILSENNMWYPDLWRWAYASRVQKPDMSLPAITSLYDHIVKFIDSEWVPPKGRLLHSARQVFCDKSRSAPWFGFLVVNDESEVDPLQRRLAAPTPFRAITPKPNPPNPNPKPKSKPKSKPNPAKPIPPKPKTRKTPPKPKSIPKSQKNK